MKYKAVVFVANVPGLKENFTSNRSLEAEAVTGRGRESVYEITREPGEPVVTVRAVRTGRVFDIPLANVTSLERYPAAEKAEQKAEQPKGGK